MSHPLLPGEPWFLVDTETRRSRLAELAAAGHRTPRNGPFGNMKRLGVPLVLYLDQYEHCGNAKALWTAGGNLTGDDRVWCSEFIGTGRGPAVSYRELVIGPHVFHLKYTSKESWMSNVDGTYFMWQHGWREHSDLIRYPMYAIDFVYEEPDGLGEKYAIDLNVCPGVPVEVINVFGRINLSHDLRVWKETNK